MKNGSKLFLIAFGILAVSIVVLFSVRGVELSGYRLDIAEDEPSAITGARAAISYSGLKGYGDMRKENCKTLGRIAKKVDGSALWFDSCDTHLQGEIADNSDVNVTKLSDGKYCATFTTDKKNKLVKKYTFEEGGCGKGYISLHEDKD